MSEAAETTTAPPPAPQPAPAPAPVQVPQPPPAPPPVPAPAPPPADLGSVPIPRPFYEELLATKVKLTQMEREQSEKNRKADEELARATMEKGELQRGMEMLRTMSERELNEERNKLANVESRAKRYALEGELARELAKQPLVSAAAAAQLTEHFRKEFEVHPEGEGFVVRTPTFQSVEQFIAGKLASPDYAHFLRATSQGGSGSNTATQTTPTPPPTPPAQEQYPTLGHELMARYGSSPNVGRYKPANPNVPDAVNIERPFGIRPASR